MQFESVDSRIPPGPPAAITRRRRRPLLLAALVITLAVAFFNSLSGQFVYDDVQQIETNQIVGHWDRITISRILTHDIKAALRQDLPDGHVYSSYYRPGFMFYLMAAYEVASRSPFRWHCVVLLLHILAAVLAFLLIRRIISQYFGDSDEAPDRFAFFAALVFAIHPVQCESVSWISGSVNPLVAVLSLASFYSYLLFKESIALAAGSINRKAILMLVAAGISYGLALFTKESAIFVPLLIAGHEFFVPPGTKPGALSPESKLRVLLHRLLSAAPFAIAVIAYLFVRSMVLGSLAGNGLDLSPARINQFGRSMLVIPSLLTRYTGLLLLPSKLSINYDFNPAGALTFGSFWAPLLFVFGCVLLLWISCAKSKIARIGFLWLLVPLVPHLNPGFFSPDELVHDRYLYLSVLGGGILVATGLTWAKNLSAAVITKALPVIASACVLLLCLLTVAQNSVWRDNKALWSNAANRAPNSRMAHFWLGTLAESRQDLGEAARQYSFAASVDPNCIDCLNNLAFVLANQGR